MATATEIRTWARAEGIEVNERGKIGAGVRRAYDDAHGGAADTYDNGVTAADFLPGPDPHPHPAEPELEEEAAPRAVEGQRGASKPPAAARARQLWGKIGRKDTGKNTGTGKAKRKAPARHPRIPAAPVIEHVWSQLAWAARPLPPMQKILAAQAPTAGLMLEDTVRDTVLDARILQPIARAEEKFKAVNALILPPLWTMAISMWGGAVTREVQGQVVVVTDERGIPVWDERTRVLVAGLRFSLMSWMEISGRHAEEIKERAETLTRQADEADQLIAWILAPPVPGEDVTAEAQRRAAAFTSAGDTPEHPPPAPDATGALEAMARSSAFGPVPAAGAHGGH